MLKSFAELKRVRIFTKTKTNIMADFKKVSMTSKEAMTFISMLEDRISVNKKAIKDAPVLMNMREEIDENKRFQFMVERLDKTFWDMNGELK